MISETAGLLTSFKAIYEISNALLGIRDSVQMNTKILELQGAIISAQQQAMAIQQGYATLEAKTNDIEAECKRLRDWSSEKENYTIHEIAFGVFAYIQKDFVGKYHSA